MMPGRVSRKDGVVDMRCNISECLIQVAERVLTHLYSLAAEVRISE